MAKWYHPPLNDSWQRWQVYDLYERYVDRGNKPQRYPTATIYTSTPGSARGYRWHLGDGKISPENRRVRWCGESDESKLQVRIDAYENADMLFEKGFIFFVAVSESGRTICLFFDAWLWLIKWFQQELRALRVRLLSLEKCLWARKIRAEKPSQGVIK